MRKPITKEEEIIRREQPLNWGRAFFAGMVGLLAMNAFVDCFSMLGLIPFSFAHYMGSLIRMSDAGTHNWTVGFLANLAVGGVFGLVYAYAFENMTRAANFRYGIRFGAVHALFAGVLVFPFFQVMRAEIQLENYSGFGFLGAGLNPALPIVLLVGHLIFGATMGSLYGPVRLDRLRSAEPGRSPEAMSPSEEESWHQAA